MGCICMPLAQAENASKFTFLLDVTQFHPRDCMFWKLEWHLIDPHAASTMLFSIGSSAPDQGSI